MATTASDRYSFVFFGQSGQLDYAFATPEAAAKVSGAEMWRINIDEPRYLDYNDNNPAERLRGQRVPLVRPRSAAHRIRWSRGRANRQGRLYRRLAMPPRTFVTL